MINIDIKFWESVKQNWSESKLDDNKENMKSTIGALVARKKEKRPQIKSAKDFLHDELEEP
jgi:hypothetical protein